MDHCPDRPPKIATDSAGEMILEESRLEAGTRTLRFVRYAQLTPNSEPTISFHPAPEESPEISRWRKTIDDYYPSILRAWRQKLIDHTVWLSEQLEDWIDKEIAMDEVIAALELEHVLLNSDGSCELRFRTSPHLGFHDLSVEMNESGHLVGVSVNG